MERFAPLLADSRCPNSSLPWIILVLLNLVRAIDRKIGMNEEERNEENHQFLIYSLFYIENWCFFRILLPLYFPIHIFPFFIFLHSTYFIFISYSHLRFNTAHELPRAWMLWWEMFSLYFRLPKSRLFHATSIEHELLLEKWSHREFECKRPQKSTAKQQQRTFFTLQDTLVHVCITSQAAKMVVVFCDWLFFRHILVLKWSWYLVRPYNSFNILLIAISAILKKPWLVFFRKYIAHCSLGYVWMSEQNYVRWLCMCAKQMKFDR